MIRLLAVCALPVAGLAALAGQARAAPIPEPVVAMIEASADNPDHLTTIARIARITNPDSIAEIDARVAAIRAATEERRVATLSGQAFREGWSGWERDPFAGFEGRTSESVGVGYRFLTGPTMTLDADIGVAARQTRFLATGDESTVGARLGLRYEWTLSPDTVFTEVASAYLDGSGTTVESTTAITTRLSGALSGRASLNVRHETDPPVAREPTDTATRFSLVYGF